MQLLESELAEPRPLPLTDVLGKSLTIRGYVVLEITTDPQRLERMVHHVMAQRSGVWSSLASWSRPIWALAAAAALAGIFLLGSAQRQQRVVVAVGFHLTGIVGATRGVVPPGKVPPRVHR